MTVGASYEQSASLLDLACKKCGIQSAEADSSRQRNSVLGFVNFGTSLIKLLRTVHKFQSCCGILQENVSITELISSEYLPLSVRAMKDFILFWKSIKDALLEFKAALESGKVSEDTVSSKNGEQPPKTKDIKKIKSQSIFTKFLEIFKGRYKKMSIYYL